MDKLDNKSLQRAALGIAIIGSFLTPFMSASVNIALPAIGKDFQIGTGLLSWVATAYLLSAAMFLLPFGKLADTHGRKKIYLGGIIIYSLMSAACALAWNGYALIVFRLLQGLGGAMIFSTGVAILTTVYPKEKRGWALGIVIASVYTGLSAGPFLGGLMVNQLGWQSIFWVNIPVGLLVVWLIVNHLHGEWADPVQGRFDWLGSVCYALSISSVMYGLSLLPKIQGWYFLIPGFILLLVFVLWERKYKNPILDTNMFLKNRVFTFSNLAAFINYSATFAVGFMMSLYLQYAKGMNPKQAGLILVSQPILMALFSPLAGRFSDKIDARILASTGMFLSAIGLAVFIFLSAASSMLYIVLGLIVLGFGFALFSSPNTNAIMSSVARKDYGVASATTGAMRLTGQMFSMGLAMLILNMKVGQSTAIQTNVPAFIQALNLSFTLFFILCLIGTVASLVRGKTR